MRARAPGSAGQGKPLAARCLENSCGSHLPSGQWRVTLQKMVGLHKPPCNRRTVGYGGQFQQQRTQAAAHRPVAGIELEQRYPKLTVPGEAENLLTHDATCQTRIAAATQDIQTVGQFGATGHPASGSESVVQAYESGIGDAILHLQCWPAWHQRRQPPAGGGRCDEDMRYADTVVHSITSFGLLMRGAASSKIVAWVVPGPCRCAVELHVGNDAVLPCVRRRTECRGDRWPDCFGGD